MANKTDVFKEGGGQTVLAQTIGLLRIRKIYGKENLTRENSSIALSISTKS